MVGWSPVRSLLQIQRDDPIIFGLLIWVKCASHHEAFFLGGGGGFYSNPFSFSFSISLGGVPT